MAQPSDACGAEKSIPLPLKAFGLGLICLSLLTLPTAAYILASLAESVTGSSPEDPTAQAILLIDALLVCASCVLGVVLGLNLLSNRRRHARRFVEMLIVSNIGILLCEVMMGGIGAASGWLVARTAFYVALSVYLDPSLSEERRLKRKLHAAENRKRALKGTLGFDRSGKGSIELNFFNLFWIFTVCSVLGLLIETVYVFALTGHYQNRTGMLFGPFSPIYGVGAVLMTLGLNRLYKRNALVVFLLSALMGGAFEYAVSWFLQFAFGIVAWDYTGQWLNIDGRTCGKYMIFWGILGCAWIKLLLPRLTRLINAVPWNWRYAVTVVCATAMLVNASATLMSLDCWYQRMAGIPPESAVEQFMAKECDNEFMANHFQSMSLNPENATRAS